LPESEARIDLAIGLWILDWLALRSLLQRLVVAVLVMRRPRHAAARQLLLDVTPGQKPWMSRSPIIVSDTK